MARRLIDKDDARESRRQLRLLLLLERRFRRVVAAEIQREARAIVAGFGVTGRVPALSDDHIQRMTSIYREMTLAAISAFGGRILDQGKAAGLALETKDFLDLFARLATEYIMGEAMRQRITSVAETTRAQIIAQVSAGQDGGLGIAEIAKSISSNIGTISKFRGALIARTETHGAANYGAHQSAIATGLPLQKVWLSANDARTRETHRDVDPEPIEMDQLFQVGGYGLMYPGDPNGPAHEIINCRCVVTHQVVG